MGRGRGWIAFTPYEDTPFSSFQLDAPGKMRKKPITAEELDKIFDEGEEDILPYLDLSKAERPGHTSRNI